nr:unnamed protein product [Callosobruchus chinensis]
MQMNASFLLSHCNQSISLLIFCFKLQTTTLWKSRRRRRFSNTH